MMTLPKILVPPYVTRMTGAFRSKNAWLENYFAFRHFHEESPDLEINAKRLLSSIGKNNSEMANKFRGCFLGLAVGDAFGTTLEFTLRKESELHTEMIGGGPFNLKPGEWTDDTSMALCLAHSLFERNTFDPTHQLELYTLWWQKGFLSSNGRCFDIGNTVHSALVKFNKTNDCYSGSDDEFSAGNGSLMRLAPVTMFFASNPHVAIEKSGLSSRTTHGNIQAIDACRYFSCLLLGAFRGEKKDTLLQPLYSPVKNYWEHFSLCNEISLIARGSYKEKKRDQIESTGYVVHSLEAALWAFYNTDNFEDGLIKAVNLGGDSDTIGAIYGQLAGAFYGELGIPFKFINPLKDKHFFYFFADEFVCFYSGRDELLNFQYVES